MNSILREMFLIAGSYFFKNFESRKKILHKPMSVAWELSPFEAVLAGKG